MQIERLSVTFCVQKKRKSTFSVIYILSKIRMHFIPLRKKCLFLSTYLRPRWAYHMLENSENIWDLRKDTFSSFLGRCDMNMMMNLSLLRDYIEKERGVTQLSCTLFGARARFSLFSVFKGPFFGRVKGSKGTRRLRIMCIIELHWDRRTDVMFNVRCFLFPPRGEKKRMLKRSAQRSESRLSFAIRMCVRDRVGKIMDRNLHKCERRNLTFLKAFRYRLANISQRN